MLKGIPSILSPDLLKMLMEMGHGDEIVIADGNFPSASIGQRVIRLDGHGVPEILDAVLKVMPLDTYVDEPVQLMDLSGDDTETPPIWSEYQIIINKHQEDVSIGKTERYAFYERAKKAYGVIATGETAIYANILLKKGVVIQ
ncbi:MAG: fucose isomerase [Oscillospiraceae bacterium]|nr:fucose isomerase [Oscillospiraceae bacterium]